MVENTSSTEILGGLTRRATSTAELYYKVQEL